MKPSTPAKWLDDIRNAVLMVQFSCNFTTFNHRISIVHSYDDTDMSRVMEYPYAQEM